MSNRPARQKRSRASQRNLRTFLRTHGLARSRKISTFSLQRSFNRGNILPGEEKRSENKTPNQLSFCFQPACTFILSPSLKHHHSQLPWGTSIFFNLYGTRRNFLPEHFQTFQWFGGNLFLKPNTHLRSSCARGTGLRVLRAPCVQRWGWDSDCVF